MTTDPTKPPHLLDLRLERFSPQLNIKQEGNKRMVFCAIRKKWLVLQPEEFVRQLLLHFFIGDMRYNRNRITVERGLTVNTKYRRTDILIFDADMRPFLLVECKEPRIELETSVYRQAATYNGPLRLPYLMVSNGRDSMVAEIDFTNESYQFLDAVPEWN